MKTKFPIFVIMALVVITGTACQSNSATPLLPAPPPSPGQPSSSQRSTDSTQSTKAASSSTSPIQTFTSSSASQGFASSQAPMYFTGSFDRNMDHYSVANRYKGDSAKMHVSLNDGSMIFDLEGPDIYSYVTYEPRTYSNVKLSVTADNRGKSNNNVILVCQQGGDGWYEFNIANNGDYWIYAYDTNGVAGPKGWQKIADGASLAIKQGTATNVYTATCQENTLSLAINGIPVKSITDHKFNFKDGKVGFGVSSFDVTPIRVNINSFQISKP